MEKSRRVVRRSRTSASLEQDAMLSLAHAAAKLEHGLVDVLKPYAITPTQYNTLRILRGAAPHGLCRSEIAERLVAQVPDVTRLLDRLETLGVIERTRDSEDRRLVTTRVTTRGLELLHRLDAPIAAYHRRQLGRLGRQKLRLLIHLLSEARDGDGANR